MNLSVKFSSGFNKMVEPEGIEPSSTKSFRSLSSTRLLGLGPITGGDRFLGSPPPTSLEFWQTITALTGRSQGAFAIPFLFLHQFGSAGFRNIFCCEVNCETPKTKLLIKQLGVQMRNLAILHLYFAESF